MAEAYDPFKRNRVDSSDENFFNRTVFKVATLFGTVWAAYKMKGPVGRITSRYIEDQRNKTIQRELDKQIDSFERILGPHANVNQPYYGIPENDGIFRDTTTKEAFNKFDFSNAQTTEFLSSVRRKEDALLHRVGTDLVDSRLRNVSESSLRTMTDGNLDIDEFLYELREKTLLEHLARNASLREEDFKQLNAFKGPKSDAGKLKDLFEFYLYNDPEYAEFYNRHLARLEKNRTMARNAFDANPNSARLTELGYKQQVYGGDEFVGGSSSSAEIRIQSGKVGQMYKRKDLPQNINVFDLVKSDFKITSGSLDKSVSISDDKRFRLISQFDYSSRIKKIAEQLQELKTTRASDAMIKDTKFEIITKGSATDPKFYARISFQHAEKNKVYSVNIPISQHGRLPGSTAATGVSHDIPRILPMSRGKKNLLVNKDLENKSQQLLNKMIEILDSNQMENEFALAPDNFIRRAQFQLDVTMQDSPLAEGTTRDSFKALSIQTRSKETEHQLRLLRDAVVTGNNIKKMASFRSEGRDFVNITLDFETVSRDLSGPQWLARDEFTEFTKAGITTSSFRDGRLVTTGAREIVSDHGYEVMKNYGWDDDTIAWLRREIGEKASKGLQTNSEVGEAWGNQIKSEAQRYQNAGGRKFRNNAEAANHVADILLKTVRLAKASGKEVFLTTKNGNAFDLKFFAIHAPNKYAQLVKEARNLIDLQSVAFSQKMGSGNQDSLALNKIMMRLMGNLDPSGREVVNIDKPGNIERALKFFHKKGWILAGSEQLDGWKEKGFVTRAHASPVADDMISNIMLVNELNKVASGDKSYQGLSDLEKSLMEHDRILGVDESWEEYKATERKYTIHGMITSSSGLSQGQIAKHMVSLLPLNHMIPFTDNQLSKQWDQLFMGNAVRPSDKFIKNISNRTDLEKKKLHNKYFKPVFISQGEISATNHLPKADAFTNAFQHEVITKSAFVLNSWSGQEGRNAFSQKVFDRVKAVQTKRVSLTDASSVESDPHLSRRIDEIKNNIYKKVKELGDAAGRINSDTYEVAAQQVLAEMAPKGMDGIPIPKGSKFAFAAGDRGFVTSKAELDGVIRNIIVDTDKADKIRMHAEVMYSAQGSQFQGITFNARSLFTKATVEHDKWLSLGTAMGGVEHVGSADFIEKGYVGAQKQGLTEKVIYSLLDQIQEGTKEERDHAEKVLKKLSVDLNASIVDGQLQHDPSKDLKFKHITDPQELADAKKYLGNIDMNFEKLNNYLVDAKVVWTKEKALQWYGMWSSSGEIGDDATIASGRRNIRKMIVQSAWNSRKDINSAISSGKGVLGSFAKDDLRNIRKEMTSHLQTYFLPDMKKVESGKAPMFFEPVKKFNNDPNSPFVPAFIHERARHTLYNINKGRAAKATDLKLRGGLLSFIDVPKSHVSDSTLDHLKESRRYNKKQRFLDAMDAVDNFKNALMSKATVQIQDLTLDDINQLVNRKAGIDLQKLKKKSLSDAEMNEVSEKVSEMLGDDLKHAENQDKAIQRILSDLQVNKLGEVFDENENMVSTQATQAWANLAKKKKVFSYSAKDLGGPLTFHIRDIMKSLELGDDELAQSTDKLINQFKTMYNAPNSIVEKFDEHTGTVTLKKIIMHADASPENIRNLLNPSGGREAVGYYSKPARYQLDVLKGIKKYHELREKLPSDNSVVKENMDKSLGYIKKQYLRYMLDGFLFDSGSVYARATEIAPRALQAPTRGAGIIMEKAQDILRTGGFAQFGSKFGRGATGQVWKDKVKKANERLRKIVANDTLQDIYVTDSMFNKMEVAVKEHGKERNTSFKSHLRTIFGDKADERLGEIQSGDQKLFGYYARHPTLQSATDSVLDLNINVISDDIGEFLNMNSNEVQVHANHFKLMGGDFDGDIGYFVAKSLKDAQSLMDYEKQHKDSLKRTLDSVTGVGKTLRETGGQKLMTDILPNGGGIQVNYHDEEGKLVSRVLDINSQEANEVINSNFDMFAKNARTLAMNRPEHVTGKYATQAVDMVGTVGVSKNAIGLFTNIAYRRTRQLLQAGLQKKDSVAAKSLMGNLKSGVAGISQMFISLAKHPDNVGLLSQAAKAFQNVWDKDPVNQQSLESIFKKMHTDQKGTELYETFIKTVKELETAAPRQTGVGQKLRALENLDFGRDNTNIADVIISQAEHDFLKVQSTPMDVRSPSQELGDHISKKFKLDSESRGVFRKSGKVGAIVGAAYMGLNFFRPNQISNSLNPLDAFTDLGVDIDGSHNGLFTNMELEAPADISMVDPSFSKKAFIKMNKDRSNKQERSNIVDALNRRSFELRSSLSPNFKTDTSFSYTNNTSHIGKFGSTGLARKSEY